MVVPAAGAVLKHTLPIIDKAMIAQSPPSSVGKSITAQFEQSGWADRSCEGSLADFIPPSPSRFGVLRCLEVLKAGLTPCGRWDISCILHRGDAHGDRYRFHQQPQPIRASAPEMRFPDSVKKVEVRAVGQERIIAPADAA